MDDFTPDDHHPANAMKHAEMGATLSFWHGRESAAVITDAHENVYEGELLQDDLTSDIAMDLYNNDVGIDIGQQVREDFRQEFGFDPNTGPEVEGGVDPDLSLTDAELNEWVMNRIDGRVLDAFHEDQLVWLNDGDGWRNEKQ